MNIEQAIRVINQMQADGVIETYAIGGAVGASYYLEPVATYDLDIFAPFPTATGGLILSPAAIYDYLKARGGVIEREYIKIGGWPVQFLPPGKPLEEEALKEAELRDMGGVPVRVFTAEHLAAIALQTGRAKDKSRLLLFVESNVLDMKRFQGVLQRHGLVDKWRGFQQQFLDDPS